METNINLDQVALLGPLMAGHVLNAYYTALLLKQNSGIELSTEVKQDTLTEVFTTWTRIQTAIEDAPKKTVSFRTSERR